MTPEEEALQSALEQAATDLEAWSGLLQIVPTKVLMWLLNCPCKIVALFTGNQFGKNEYATIDILFSILGIHPVPHKNILPEDKVRTIRLASATLPKEKDDKDEVKNTQYPVIKKRFPPQMIVKDITTTKHVLVVNPPIGDRIQIEFVSFAQDVQEGAGVQRRRIWIDEECSVDFLEEQIPRLLAADGDLLFTFTPVPGSVGWAFDYLYERARIIYRTEHVRNRIKKVHDIDVPEVETRESQHDIAVIMAATDDNPLYEALAERKSKILKRSITASEYIDGEYLLINDEDAISARRYGLFMQASGKIYPTFNKTIHRIRYHQYFPQGVPYQWKHARTMDYHPHVPCAVLWTSISLQNEIFVWGEYAPALAKINTFEATKMMAELSLDYKYTVNLIDPLACVMQPRTNTSVRDDINEFFATFKKNGVGTGAYFEPFDTRPTRGREEMRIRLANATKVKVPFNNKCVVEDDSGIPSTVYLPTIWFCDTVPMCIDSMYRWKLSTWNSRDAQMRNEIKETPENAFSHFPTALEGLLKHPGFTKPSRRTNFDSPRPKQYFSRVA